jgi:hypothetical protein
MNEEIKYLYRYESENYYENVIIKLYEYEITKKTEKGFWIKLDHNDSDGNVKKRFVKQSGKKMYARETKELAINDYIYRRQLYSIILEQNLKNNNQLLGELKFILENENNIENEYRIKIKDIN